MTLNQNVWRSKWSENENFESRNDIGAKYQKDKMTFGEISKGQ